MAGKGAKEISYSDLLNELDRQIKVKSKLKKDRPHKESISNIGRKYCEKRTTIIEKMNDLNELSTKYNLECADDIKAINGSLQKIINRFSNHSIKKEIKTHFDLLRKPLPLLLSKFKPRWGAKEPHNARAVFWTVAREAKFLAEKLGQGIKNHRSKALSAEEQNILRAKILNYIYKNVKRDPDGGFRSEDELESEL